MISYQTYKILHIFAILLAFVSLSGMTVDAFLGGTKESSRIRKTLMIGHGIGLVLALVGGMGLMARLGIAHGAPWPGWIWGKFSLWLVVGALVALPYRLPHLSRPLLLALPFVGAFGAWLAVFKPF